MNGNGAVIVSLRWSNEREVTRRRAVKKEPCPVDRINPKDAFFIGSKSLWVSLSQLSQLLLMDDVETYRIIVRNKTANGSLIYCVEIAEPGKVEFLAVRNEKDMVEVPKKGRNGMKFVYVSGAMEVLKAALEAKG